MNALWKKLLIGGFLVAFVVLLGFFNATKPRILVLHSGAADALWVREVDRGMRESLAMNRRPLAVEWHYMAVNAPAAKHRFAESKAQAARAISRFAPHVIIAVDDEANDWLASAYEGKDRPRILYVSIDRQPHDYGYENAPNVTGIVERLPLSAIRDAALLLPGRRSIAVLGVDNETGCAEMAQVQAFDWQPLLLEKTALVATMDEWREFVKALSASDVLLVLSTHDLPEGGKTVSASEVVSWTQGHAKALPVGTQVDFVEEGGALSLAPPPDDYGRKAISLALDWLDARDTPGAPTPVESEHFEVAVRPSLLRERGIVLPPIYLEAARENGTLYE